MKAIPIVILGATGTGKSKLATEVAQRFCGEIINADSMQIYQGLDIVTNKVKKEDQKSVVHHLLGFLDPLENFTVVDYRNKALPIINNLLENNKNPIIVGGTNYYIESLLWKVLLDPPIKDKIENFEKHNGLNYYKQENVRKKLEMMTDPNLYMQLCEVDPEMASCLHPNNRRKIIRAIEVYYSYNRKLSSILKEQQQEGGSYLGGPLRFLETCVLWLQCEKDVLAKRLSLRIEDMVQNGLRKELEDFHEKYIKTLNNVDYTKGIYQSIGLKQFHNYLSLDKNLKYTELGNKVFLESIDNLFVATRRYAKKQEKWICNRFLRETGRQVPPVYALDTTNIAEWDKLVLNPAFEIVHSVLQNLHTCYEPLKRLPNIHNEFKIFHCDVCNCTFVNSVQWISHQNSDKHCIKSLQCSRISESKESDKTLG